MKINKTNSRGKLIVIEGGDGAGKGTQTKMLIDVFKIHGLTVSTLDFPRYEESLFGALCGRALKGEFGDFRHMSPYIASLPYTLDRASAKEKIKEHLKNGIVISNRYTPSNVAFQSTKLNGKKKKEFITFLENAEYGEMGLPKPDLVIYLHVPMKIAHELVAKKEARSYLALKKGKRDQHEQDKKYQADVIKTYRELANERPDWVCIECTKKGKIMTPEEIHTMVFEQVLKLLDTKVSFFTT